MVRTLAEINADKKALAEEEKKALADDIKDIYAEAKSTGFDAKIMRQIIRLRKMDENDRQEQEALLDVYTHALGMIRG